MDIPVEIVFHNMPSTPVVETEIRNRVAKLDRLYEKGLIFEPKNKAKSVSLTEEGVAKSADLFQRHFGASKTTLDKKTT